jgi:antitoxin (DNA-binding transcriptional repressor) of toxin-antitoxin stability system
MVMERAMVFNVSEAKAKLSKLIDMAYHGEEVVIAKNNLPLVEFSVPDDFNEESEEINEMFYGRD